MMFLTWLRFVSLLWLPKQCLSLVVVNDVVAIRKLLCRLVIAQQVTVMEKIYQMGCTQNRAHKRDQLKIVSVCP